MVPPFLTPASMSTPRHSRPALLLVASSLWGCSAVGPDYQPPDPDVPSRWNRLDASTEAVAQPVAPGDLSEWWRRLNDPLLAELVAEAMQANPDLHSARARVREARARRAVAASERLPTVDAVGNASRTEPSEETGSGESRQLFSAGFDASWEIDVFGGVRRGVEAAEADLEATQADLQATQVSLAAEVASSYVEVRAQQALLGIARGNLATQSETLQLTEWREQAGLVSSQDVAQARSNREQTRAQIPVIETNLAAAEHSLEILLARAPGTLRERLSGAGDLPVAPTQIAVGIPADTLRQRPDVRAAERTLAAETARVGVAEAARYPAFSLSGSIGLEALTLGALGDTAAVTNSLLAGVTAPVFNAGRLRSQVEAQDAVREQALAAYRQAVLTALQDVENALVDLSRNRDRSEALANAVGAARSAAELARLRYGTGLLDFQPVLDSERNVLLLEESLARSRADGVLALVSLYKALGGGWSATLPPAATKELP